ncbi:internal virion protein B [Klebsiella phage KMI4]|uniref:Internal virion protein gp14 n=4 Tax=Przondovirus TaxID=1985720 RepID=A0A5B9NF01_9CAUD|nr:internal virion protein [Klebsiella phage vB_KpnP_BIS33]YP_009787547.1 internal virion protein [Klebsiella phage vB_KpnP_IL33]QEG10051.1 internal virion protein B [Klebsiella phage KMI4]UGC97348.1 internal virion protein [Klebsiella phage vB_KpnP_ZK2]ARB12449.1 internal virion protein B [Klebsiella phage vB_KpnP_IL33]ARB12497.1 internal virion protein B [Klebsiella phage vB_KpnP_BIS33]
MCWVAAIPIAMMAVQSVSSSRNAAQATGLQNDQMRRQSAQMIKESNIQNANASLEQKQKLEEASADLTAKNLDKVQAMGTIRAAIGEGNLEGASMDRIGRIEEGKFIREANAVTDNYRRDYASLFAQQLGNSESTMDQVKSMQKAEGKGKSKLEQVLDPLALMGSQAASAYASGAFDSKSTKAPISQAKGTKVGGK